MDFKYSYRISKKAKRVIVKIDTFSQVEVVLPVGVSPKRVPGVIAENRQWIEKTRCRLEKQRPAENPHILPEQINFQLTSEQWQIDYLPAKNLNVRDVGNNRLQVEGDETNFLAIYQQLECWLIQYAKQILVEKLQVLSKTLNLPMGTISIRHQKSRWGSCSAKKNISLNCRLMFLNEDQVRYLMIHELCHTRVMNHSRKFWYTVKQYEADYLRLDRSLNQSTHLIPQWLFYLHQNRPTPNKASP